MWRDPFTLVVAVGKDGSAEGELYLDDGDSYAYRQGQYIHRSFRLAPQGKHRYSFRSSNLVGVASDYFGGTELASYSPDENAWAKAIATVRVEQIVILGLSKEPSSVTVGGAKTAYQWTAGKAATSHSEGEASHLIIKDPKVLVSYDWDVEIA
jgi:alpha 1,3-glucosidase